MKKNECALEMILDLVMRHGCEVKIRPYAGGGRAVEIVIQHRGVFSANAIDLEKIGMLKANQDEIVCIEIERTAMDLFRLPYREMFEKHFRKENNNG